MASINRKFIQSALGSLKLNRRVFHSEDDFQHELAWTIRDSLKGKVQIRLERPFELSAEKNPAEVDAMHVDILIRPDNSANWVALELKHKTQALECRLPIKGSKEQFNLKTQGAQNHSRYDFWQDVHRLERLIKAGMVTRGYAIMLTNDHHYWQERDPTTQDREFNLHEGLKVQGKLSWVCGDSSLKKKGRRQCSIRLREEYQLEWKPYSEINGQEFRYLLLEV